MHATASNRLTWRIVALAVLAALALAIGAAGAEPASAQPLPPPCGPGQKPSTDTCFPPAQCQAGQDPVLDECTPGPNPLWPDPPRQTQDCARYYAYQGTSRCDAISSHYTYAGQPVYQPTPTRTDEYCYHLLLQYCEYPGNHVPQLPPR